MTIVTEIEYSIRLAADPGALLHRREDTQVLIVAGAWPEAPENGDACAATVAKAFFTRPAWENWIGAEEGAANAIVEIHKPAVNAGIFLVEMELMVRAKVAPWTGGPLDG